MQDLHRILHSINMRPLDDVTVSKIERDAEKKAEWGIPFLGYILTVIALGAFFGTAHPWDYVIPIGIIVLGAYLSKNAILFRYKPHWEKRPTNVGYQVDTTAERLYYIFSPVRVFVTGWLLATPIDVPEQVIPATKAATLRQNNIFVFAMVLFKDHTPQRWILYAIEHNAKKWDPVPIATF